jgi:hypothetical protein
MQGLVCRAMELFVTASRGGAVWSRIAARAGLAELASAPVEPFLPMPADAPDRLLRAARAELQRPAAALLEDMGTHLVTHPACERVRRLLRFGGADYADFLHSLQDLPARAALALPDLVLPAITVDEAQAGRFAITVAPGLPGFGPVAAGMMRAMADDYGALVLLRLRAGRGGACRIGVELADTGHAAPRGFALAVAGAA